MLDKKIIKKYELYGARIEDEKGPPLIVIQIPWKEFCHPLACDEYAGSLVKTKYLPIVVSQSPEKEWKADGAFASLWPSLIAKTKPEELNWHTIPVEGDTSPPEELQKWISLGF